MTRPTSAELIESAVRGHPVQRLPAALWGHFPGRDTTSRELAASVIEYHRAHRFDLVKITHASGYGAEAWGARLEPDDNAEGTRRYVERPVKVAADWRSLRPLDPDSGVLARELSAITHIKAGVGPDVHVLPTVFSPLTLAKQLAGRDVLLRHLHHCPEDLMVGLSVIAETMARFAESCLRKGADGIFFATQFARRDVLSVDQYEAFGQSYDRMVLDAMAGSDALLVLHLCGENVMFELADLYEAHIVNWHEGGSSPSLAEGLASRRWGAVLGGLDRRRLVTASPAEIAADVAQTIAEAGDRRIILGAGCVTLVGTPDANLDAVRQAVQGAGGSAAADHH